VRNVSSFERSVAAELGLGLVSSTVGNDEGEFHV